MQFLGPARLVSGCFQLIIIANKDVFSLPPFVCLLVLKKFTSMITYTTFWNE